MKISTRSRYGVRFMIHLAVHYGRGVVHLHEAAQAEGISEKYLSQIVIPMRNKGLLLSARGANGGHTLARHPSGITLRDIVEAIEGDISLMDAPGLDLERDSALVTRDVWESLARTIASELEKVSLKDLVDQVLVRHEQPLAGAYQI
jgi:Rrf2 family protein